MLTEAQPVRRTFGLSDQISFAELSGDWNPVHIDPVFSRRLPTGIVVHGVHLTLWTLDRFVAVAGRPPASVCATFRKPVALDEECALSVEREGGAWRAQVHQGGQVSATFRIVPGERRFEETCAERKHVYPRCAPHAARYSQERVADGLAPAADSSALRSAFPHLVEALGTLRVAALNGISTVIGMRYPGLHSLLSGVDLSFVPAEGQELRYEVVRASHPAAPIKLAFKGAGVLGSASAFFRPEPVNQPTYAQARAAARSAEFLGQVALVIGGSRGLGETAAKTVCAGGGSAIITYHQGALDAERVRDEITSGGGHCRTARFDVRQELDLPERALVGQATHIYYLATPAIRVNSAEHFRASLFMNYVDYYVAGLARVCRWIPANKSISIFYPSTIFLDSAPKGAAEYVAAKAAGEALCAGLSRERPNLKVFCPRLPRTSTDQTSGLFGAKAADPLEVILTSLRTMK